MADRKRTLVLVSALAVAVLGASPQVRAQDGLTAAPSEPDGTEEHARLAALKDARAEAILLREEGRGRTFDPVFRARTKAQLAASPLEALEAVEARGTGLFPAPAALGDSAADLVYTPVAPCRIVDTRLSGGVLGAGGQRSFIVTGSSGFAGQGGNPAGCGVPSGPATAAVVNFVAAGPAGAGNLRAWAFGGAVPNASIVNYAAVGGLNIANAVVVPLCNQATTSCGPFDITVQADGSGTQIVADVAGYFRNVVKGQYRSFAEWSVRSNLLITLPATGCTNTGAAQVTVTAPVAGQIVVEGRAIYAINHMTGTQDHINTFIGTSATDCEPDYGLADVLTVPPEDPTAPNVNRSAHARRVFDVAPGTYTYYLNPRGVTGGGNDRINHASLIATFHPD
jgi:hypothetical protein